MKKVTKEFWIKAGIQMLAEKGEDFLTIDLLCDRLKVSKGSFYHHFKNIDQYIGSLFNFWAEENTVGIINETEKAKNFDQKVQTLNDLVLSKDMSLEVKIRAWGVRDTSVGEVVQKIDAMRVTYLSKLYQEKGLAQKEANDMALIEYAALVGAQFTLSALPAKDFQRLGLKFQQIIQTYLK